MLLKQIGELKPADSCRLHKHSGGQLTDVLKELHVCWQTERNRHYVNCLILRYDGPAWPTKSCASLREVLAWPLSTIIGYI